MRSLCGVLTDIVRKNQKSYGIFLGRNNLQDCIAISMSSAVIVRNAGKGDAHGIPSGPSLVAKHKPTMVIAAPAILAVIVLRSSRRMDRQEKAKHNTAPPIKSIIVIHISSILQKGCVTTSSNTVFDDKKEQSVNLNIIINNDYVN